MYQGTATFGITAPVYHDRVVNVIDGELHNMDWYRDNGHTQIALAIPGYIVGFILFNYAVPKPDKDLLHLYFQIVENTYFKSLGFESEYYNIHKNTFNKKNIHRAIEQVVAENRAKYNKLNPAYKILRYDSLVDFAKSYLLLVRNLDVTKTE